jgi:hypothetical protein
MTNLPSVERYNRLRGYVAYEEEAGLIVERLKLVRRESREEWSRGCLDGHDAGA